MKEKNISKIGILQKITNFLLGFVLSFFIFFLSLKIFGEIFPAVVAGGIGAIISLAAAIYIIKKSESSPAKRIVGIGVLCSVAAIIIIPFILWMLALTLFQGVAN